MRILTALVICTISGVLFTGCKKAGVFKKTKGGLPYTYYSGNGKVKLQKEGFIKFHFSQKKNDSLIYDTRAKGYPVYQQSSGMSQPYDLSELFLLDLKKGDSIKASQMLDSFIKRNPSLERQGFKKGDQIHTFIKILDIFNSQEEYMADKAKEDEKFLAGEIKVIEAYIAEKKITAQKSGKGTYVQLLSPGAGTAIDTGKFVSLKYRGSTLDGVEFQANFDSTGKVIQPLSFVVGQQQMIPGMEDGVKGLSKGAKAVLYIPSMLAYAAQPPTPLIKPFDKLKFEIEVLDVQDKAPPPPPMPKASVPPPPPPAPK